MKGVTYAGKWAVVIIAIWQVQWFSEQLEGLLILALACYFRDFGRTEW